MIKKLEKMPCANARVIELDNTSAVLQSYNTDVVYMSHGWLYVSGLYSATTRKHISAFMTEYTTKDYYFARAIAGTHQAINLRTGETMLEDDFFKMFNH